MWNIVGYYPTQLSKESPFAIVVKNPLSPVEHSGGIGVNNKLFEESLEQFVISTTIAIVQPVLLICGVRHAFVLKEL